MKFSEIQLPSNRKFGFFFTFVFAVAATYFITSGNLIWVYTFGVASFFLFIVTLVKSDALLPLNKLWMRFGILLGMIVSPVVLLIIFYGLITPYSLAMKIFGRDELHLKIKKDGTHWRARSQVMPQTDFTKQF